MTLPVIWLTGMPRSGTTWISQIFAASPEVRVKFCPLFSYRFKNVMTAESTPEAWAAFFEQVYHATDPYMDQCHLRKKNLVPDFAHPPSASATLLIKSNRQHHLTETILRSMPHIRFFAVVRDPFAAVHSWLSDPEEFPATADPMTQWRTGTCRKTNVGEYWGFDDWKQVTTMHLQLAQNYPAQFVLRRYEDLKVDPIEQLRELFETFNLSFLPQVRRFIEESISRHEESPHSVFKQRQRAAKWQQELHPDIIDAIRSEIQGTKLAQFAESHKE